MPVISFANPKGGSGKTTSALLLASELARKGATITIIDADPEKWLSQWGRLDGKPDNIQIIEEVDEDSIVDEIDDAAAKSQFVIVDLEGTASLMVANAIVRSDLVIVPTQGGSMDAKGAAKTIRLVNNQAKLGRGHIPHRVLLTRVSAAIPSRALKNVREQLDKAGIEVCSSTIVERAAYRDIMDFGGLLSDLNPKNVSNVEKAVENAKEFAAEVIAILREAREESKVA